MRVDFTAQRRVHVYLEASKEPADAPAKFLNKMRTRPQGDSLPSLHYPENKTGENMKKKLVLLILGMAILARRDLQENSGAGTEWKSSESR